MATPTGIRSMSILVSEKAAIINNTTIIINPNIKQLPTLGWIFIGSPLAKWIWFLI